MCITSQQKVTHGDYTLCQGWKVRLKIFGHDKWKQHTDEHEKQNRPQNRNFSNSRSRDRSRMDGSRTFWLKMTKSTLKSSDYIAVASLSLSPSLSLSLAPSRSYGKSVFPNWAIVGLHSLLSSVGTTNGFGGTGKRLPASVLIGLFHRCTQPSKFMTVIFKTSWRGGTAVLPVGGSI